MVTNLKAIAIYNSAYYSSAIVHTDEFTDRALVVNLALTMRNIVTTITGMIQETRDENNGISSRKSASVRGGGV